MIAPELADFRKELIQTAAVAVAIIEDIDYGIADSIHVEDGRRRFQTADILHEIHDERRRQDLKWGPQTHRWSDWLSILGEEFGEACAAYNDNLLVLTMQADEKLNSAKLVRWGKVDPATYGKPSTRLITEREALAHADQRIIEGYAPPLTFEVDPKDRHEGRFDRED